MTSASSVSSAVNRVGAFVVVGAVGFAFQLTVLAVLMSFAHWTWLPATIAAVELAVIHNFCWHERFTWKDRLVGLEETSRSRRLNVLERFLRFNGATALTSVLGNVLLMAIYVGVLGLPTLLANVAAVGTMSVANFWSPIGGCSGQGGAGGAGGERPLPLPKKRQRRLAVALAGACAFSAVASAAPSPATVAAWNQYVAQAEKRLDPARRTAVAGGIDPRRSRQEAVPSGWKAVRSATGAGRSSSRT